MASEDSSSANFPRTIEGRDAHRKVRVKTIQLDVKALKLIDERAVKTESKDTKAAPSLWERRVSSLDFPSCRISHC